MLRHLFTLHAAWRWFGAAAAGLLLRDRLGPWTTAGVVAALALAGSLAGAAILRTSPVGRVSWQSRAAAWLLPWGHVFGGGSLSRIVVTSTTITSLLGAAGAIGPASPWLVAAWLLNGLVAFGFLRTMLQHCHHPAQRRAVMRPLLLLAACAGGGLLAAGLDWPRLGAVIAGGPPLAGLLLVGLYFGIVLLARPTRWN